MYKINLAGNPSSCLLKIEKQKFRALVDSGAEVSLMHERVYRSLKQAPKLTNKVINLQSVNGGVLDVKGCAEISFEIKGEKLKHVFYVVGNMNRNLILGRDWMTQNGVRLYFDLGCLRVGKTYAPLEEDIHIASIVRLTSRIVVTPQTSKICWTRARNNVAFPTSKIYQISPLDRGHIASEPGLMVTNSVGKLNGRRKIPVFIVNNTNKTFRLNRGSVVGRISAVREE